MQLNKALLTLVQNSNNSNIDNVINCIQILLTQGAHIEAEEQLSGKTALMLACEKGYLMIVNELLQKQAPVNQKDQYHNTPIFYAIESKEENLDVVSTLIDFGADINNISLDGWTPLLKAAKK